MRKICLFTSTRAEFGLLSGLARAIASDQELALQLLVSGTHLSAAHGETVRDIEAAGFRPDARVPILDGADPAADGVAVCQVMGRAMSRYGEALARLAPDILVILGDRYEAFCCAAAAQICRVPIAHIHGGETTEGAVDESFRHAITKMSQLHFPCCEAYRRRIIQLGEDPARVFNVGALGVENIRKLELLSRDELSAALGSVASRPFFLVTFHPVTLEPGAGEDQIAALLEAFDRMPEFGLIFTGANADPGGSSIQARIEAYAAAQAGRAVAVKSLGLARYLSAMKHCAAVVGNSSSGILEAPALGVPTVDIGDRQKGRVCASSVVHCAPDADAIEAALRRVCSPAFLREVSGAANPFDGANTAEKIAAVLKRAPLDQILKKRFHDYPLPAQPEPPLSGEAPARSYARKCLVVGYGSIGKRHAEVLKALGCQVAVASRHARLADTPCFSSVREAVAAFSPEYAVVCSRTADHVATLDELAASAFSGACLVEKPIAAAFAQIGAAPRFPTAVGYPLRFHPLMRRAKALLAGQKLLSLHAYVGQYLPEWRPGTDYRQCYSAHRDQGGGVLRDLSHELDYLQYLAGPWRRVCASGGHRSALEIDSDDQYLLLLKLQACEDVVCHLDYLSRTPQRFFLVQYEGGTLVVDFIESRLTHNGAAELFAPGRNEMFAEMHRSFFEAPESGSPLCSWEEAVDTLRLVEAAEESVRQEKWICRENL